MRKTFLAAVSAALLLLPASIAQGAELLYWNNFDDSTVAFSDIGGGGGGPLNLGEIDIDGPEGMAYDSATGRLFVASTDGGSSGQIVTVNVDGSGAAVFSAPGAPVDNPNGIAIDPTSRTAYWFNTGDESVAWARLDGSAGGTLNTAGATLDGGFRMVLDPAGGRVYWVNGAGFDSISFANVNNTGGGDLDIEGATHTGNIRALALDPAAGRIYWIDEEDEGISFAKLDGSGGGDLDLGVEIGNPFGLAFDPLLDRLYWGEVSNGRDKAFRFANLGGGGGDINIATAPVAESQDPVILKSPTGTAVPTVSRDPKSRSALSCSTGTWAPDFAGSFVYRAPSKFAYQWLRDGQPVAGATAAGLTATAPGAYACTVTASNQAGAAAQTSAATTISPGQLQLILKRKVVAKPGKLARLKLQIANVGDLATTPAMLCLKTGKRAKALKAAKCKKLGPLPAGAKLAGTLKLKVGAGASGTYRVKLTVKGAPAKPATAKIVVK